MSKAEQLLALAKQRQQAKWEGFANIGDFHDGRYDCDYVSPWTKSASNYNSPIMLVAQDWAGADYLRQPFKEHTAELGYDPYLETNINLQDLLKRHLSLSFRDTYATNLFPFVKVGGMSANIPVHAYRRAAAEFLVPQIKIVDPIAIICIGSPAFKYASAALANSKPVNLADAIANPVKLGKATLYAVAHTGRLGMNGRGRDLVEQDWAKLARQIN